VSNTLSKVQESQPIAEAATALAPLTQKQKNFSCGCREHYRRSGDTLTDFAAAAGAKGIVGGLDDKKKVEEQLEE
jgi:hypothetical protein